MNSDLSGCDGLPGLAERWALVVPHREHLLAIAQRRCPTVHDAEDCVQEAMVRAVAYPALDPSRVAALLTAMVVRTAADHARRRQRELRGRLRLATVPEQAPPPDEAVVDRGEAVWLAAQVERLPERERQVFQQRAAGLSVGETASHLRLSYKAVESAFTRARGRLRLWAALSGLSLGAWLRRVRNHRGLASALAAASVGLMLGGGPGATPVAAGASKNPPARQGAPWFRDVGARDVSAGAGAGTTGGPVAADVTTRRTTRANRTPGSGPSNSSPPPDLAVRTGPVRVPDSGGQGFGDVGVLVWTGGDLVQPTVDCITGFNTNPHTLGC